LELGLLVMKESDRIRFEMVWDNYFAPIARQYGMTKGETWTAKTIFVTTAYGQHRMGRSAQEIVMAGEAAVRPYMKPRRAYRGGCRKCDYCGRPRVDQESQCPGCGAWNEQLR
jgi:hypothetical protein